MAKDWNWREPGLRELIQIRDGPQGALVRHQMTVPRGDLIEWHSEGERYPLTDSGWSERFKIGLQKVAPVSGEKTNAGDAEEQSVMSRDFDAALPGFESWFCH